MERAVSKLVEAVFSPPIAFLIYLDLLSHAQYVSANDITDIVGVLIITYFADEVDGVAELVERHSFMMGSRKRR